MNLFPIKHTGLWKTTDFIVLQMFWLHDYWMITATNSHILHTPI